MYMLKLIFSMPEKYPLDMVVHFELEIDWDWVKRVVDYMESECIKRGIKFIRIRPRQTWSELYKKYDLPSRAQDGVTVHIKWTVKFNLENG